MCVRVCVCAVATVFTICTHESGHMSLCVCLALSLLADASAHANINNLSYVRAYVRVCILYMYKHVANILSSVHMHACVQPTSAWARVCLNMCVRGCCRQVEDCLPPEGLSLPAACGNHGALPGYKPLVCTDKKTWRAKINYLQADPCTPRLAWHFSCIKCHYVWSHQIYCLFYLSTV